MWKIYSGGESNFVIMLIISFDKMISYVRK